MEQGSQGGEVMKDAASGIMMQLDAINQFAQSIGEMQPEAAEMGMQGVEMIKGMLQKLGVQQGEAGPAQSGSPDMAGTGAVPTDNRMR